MAGIHDIKNALVKLIGQELPDVDVMYTRKFGPSSRWVLVGEIQGTVDPFQTGPKTSIKWQFQWNVGIQCGSGPVQGTPQEADALAYGLAKSVMEVVAANPTLGVSGAYMAQPVSVRQTENWENESQESVLEVAIYVKTKGA